MKENARTGQRKARQAKAREKATYDRKKYDGTQAASEEA
jgi:hypothetical protein